MPQIVSRFIQVHVVRNRSTGPEYLLLRRAAGLKHYPNIWQVVTGSIEEGESATQTAKREIAEETSLETEALFAIHYLASYFTPDDDQINLAPVFAAIVGENAEPVLSDEHQAFEWLSFEDAIAKLVFASQIEGTRIIHHHLLTHGTLEHHIRI